ncbi:hypothetical protein I6F38_35585, partial [Bradyrhizobium sp. BRP56]|nr:hypothetical protein [Bradyrhizobium sp. BRP56]
IGRMRRFIPRKTDLVTLSTARFRQFIAAYNNTPRKCLDYRTPAESFAQVLHFECESTSRLSPGRRVVRVARLNPSFTIWKRPLRTVRAGLWGISA